MKISLNWLKQYIKIEQSVEQVKAILTDTGLEVEGVTQYEKVKGGLSGVVIGEVLTCEKHPNADKLSVTNVDIGNEQPLPIVCGAPNIAKGQKVAVATVGTTLYPAGGEGFKIKKTKIRGQLSVGMICAEDELGLGQNHEGILVLDTNLANGMPLAQHFQLENDQIFEIGLTPNRADAMGHIGVARDLKAISGNEIAWPSVDSFKVKNTNLPIPVEVENAEACPRYSGVSIQGVKIAPSPDWLQHRLKSIGLTPINNVVDITNFVLHELGQPLHAFDADQIVGKKVIVKTLNKGTKFTSLDGVERTLEADDLMICDGEGKGMCIAGVFGGIDSGVKEQTTNIFLECAYFSPDYIRRTAKNHGLKTDASFRYERGTDPNITVYALKRAALFIEEIAGGTVASDIIDIYHDPIKNQEINIKYSHIDRLIGKNIDKELIHQILDRLDIHIINKTENGFKVAVPPYRVDVQREADVIEEILRIYGFNNVPIPEHIGSSFLANFPKVDRHQVRNKISQQLVAKGFFEIMTNSLTKPKYAKLHGHSEKNNVEIINFLSEDLSVMRQSLLFSGLEVLAHNINRKQKNLKIFEFGKGYTKTHKGYHEYEQLAILITGDYKEEHWKNKQRESDFYDLKAITLASLRKVTNAQLTSEISDNQKYNYSIDIKAEGKLIATLGKLNSSVTKEIGIEQEVFYTNIDWDLLLTMTNHNIVSEAISKYPEVRRDLSLVVDNSIDYETIMVTAQQTERKLLKRINVFDVYQGNKIDENKKAYAMSFYLQDAQKTLTEKVIDKTMNRLMSTFENKLGAIIRK